MEFHSEYFSDWKDVNLGFRINAFVEGLWISPYINSLDDSALHKPIAWPLKAKAVSLSNGDTFYCFPFLCDRDVIWQQVSFIRKTYKKVEIMLLDYDDATAQPGYMFGGNEMKVQRSNIIFRGQPDKFLKQSSLDLQRYISWKHMLIENHSKE